jgi:hypothetical protein
VQEKMNSQETADVQIKELVAKHALCPIDALSTETRLGEDLKIIGDDAEEFLKEFAAQFNVDMSGMVFSDYFPEEGTSEMHYYLTAIARGGNQNELLRSLKLLESKFWGMFTEKTFFKTVTIEKLLLAVRRGKWLD